MKGFSKVLCFVLTLFFISGCQGNIKTSQNAQTATEPILQASVEPKQNTQTPTGTAPSVKVLTLGEDEDVSMISDINKAISLNKPYEITFNKDYPISGRVKFDFDHDGVNEKLEYETTFDNNPSKMQKIISCTLLYKGKKLVCKYDANGDTWNIGFVVLGIIDANKSDKTTEIYLKTEGMNGLSNGIGYYLYRLSDKGIVEAGSMHGKIMGLSGDGKIYYWGGNLLDKGSIDKFDTNEVLIYYDIESQKLIKTSQIIGKRFIANYEVIVYKASNDVIRGAPVSVEEKIKGREDIIIKRIKPGEGYTVIALEDAFEEHMNKVHLSDTGVKVKTDDGKEGYIGGFHMVWD